MVGSPVIMVGEPLLVLTGTTGVTKPLWLTYDTGYCRLLWLCLRESHRASLRNQSHLLLSPPFAHQSSSGLCVWHRSGMLYKSFPASCLLLRACSQDHTAPRCSLHPGHTGHAPSYPTRAVWSVI